MANTRCSIPDNFAMTIPVKYVTVGIPSCHIHSGMWPLSWWYDNHQLQYKNDALVGTISLHHSSLQAIKYLVMHS